MTFKKFCFEYIIIGEVHRTKNVDSILSCDPSSRMGRAVRTTELHIIGDICGLCRFGQSLHKDETEAEEEEEKSKKVIEALHNIFRLFL